MKKQYKKNIRRRLFYIHNAGFTLIEIIIVLAITVSVFSFGFFVSLNSYQRYMMSSERDVIVTLLYRARSLAQNNIGGVAHGLYISDSNYVLFQGSYYDKNSSSNQIFDRSSNIQISGLTEVIFLPVTANVNNEGTINITSNTNVKKILINHEGGIDW